MYIIIVTHFSIVVNFDRDYSPGYIFDWYFWTLKGTTYLAYSFLNIHTLRRGIEANVDILKLLIKITNWLLK